MNKARSKIVKKLIVLGLTALTVLFFILSSIYIGRTSFTGSIQIGLGELSSDKYKVVGITPLGKEAQFSKYDYFYFDDSFRLLKEIHIHIDTNINIDKQLIVNKQNYKDLAKTTPNLKINIETSGTKTSKHIINFSKFLLRKSWVIFVIFSLFISLIFSVFSRKDLVKISSKVKSLIKEKPRLIASIYLGISLTIILLTGTTEWSNSVISGYAPDQIDYQNMAVNFSLGAGINQSGEFFDNYNYKTVYSDREAQVQKNILFKNFHRHPAYSILLGSLYFIFGNNPIIGKILNLIFIIISSIMIIKISRKFGKNLSNIAILVSPFYMLYLFQFIETISPDLVSVTINTIIFYNILLLKENTSTKKAIFTGLLMGLSFLFKISLAIFFAFVLLDFLIFAIKKHKLKELILLSIFFIITWLPYNIYAINYSYKEKTKAQKIISKIEQNQYEEAVYLLKDFGVKDYALPSTDDFIYFNDEIIPIFEKQNYVILSEIDSPSIESLTHILYAAKHSHIFLMIRIHGSTGLMDINNEYAENGNPSHEWTKHPESFYLNDGLQNRQPLYRVLNFYKKNPKMIFSISKNKLDSYFSGSMILFFTNFLSLILLTLIGLNNLKNRKQIILIATSVLIFIALQLNIVSNYLIFIPLTIFLFYTKTINLKNLNFIIYMLFSLYIFPIITTGNPKYLIYYDFVVYLLFIFILTKAYEELLNIIKKQRYEIV